jgi:glucose/arabinose dehydrogenase
MNCLDARSTEPETVGATVVECRFVEAAIEIDGKSGDPLWTHVPEVGPFAVPWLEGGARMPRQAGHARIAWDRQYVYFLAEFDDLDLTASVTEPDASLVTDDRLELFLKPSETHAGYYRFDLSPAGAVAGTFFPRRQEEKADGDRSDVVFHVEAAVHLNGSLNDPGGTDKGWSVEGRIPWRDLMRTGGRPNPGETWRFALVRYDLSAGSGPSVISTTAPVTTNPPDFHRHDDYLPLTFAGPAHRPDGRPYGVDPWTPVTSSRVVGSPDPPLPYRASRVWPSLALSWPITALVQPGTRRLLFVDQAISYGPATLRRTFDDPSDGQAETLLEFDGAAYSLAVHPRFEENGCLYVGMNGPATGSPKRTRIVRYTIGRQPPYALDPASAATIIEWESDGHNGGAAAFGLDGMMVVTSGDGTSDSDTNVVGQGMDHLLAKVLRIDVDHPDPGKGYSVPPDNPFVGREGIRPETWAFGFRNPWRIAVDPVQGHVWVGNNGQDLWEQVFRVERGANYGWSVFEGSHLFYPQRALGPAPHSPPAFEHPHSEARSLTGGVVYQGSRHAELAGAYLYGDYSTGKVWGARMEGNRVLWHKELADTTLAITGFALDADGEILILDHRGDGLGGFHTLEPSPEEESPRAFPRWLSESGLFASVRGHQMAPGVIGYSVNSPLWSDGAHKERYIALPAEGPAGAPQSPAIDLTATRGWNFPDGTVLIKSFALEGDAGTAPSRQWIETRFLTKQEGEWVGYSYRWNDEQTDAELVGRDGLDATFEVAGQGGMVRKAWRFPSRTECMVCHSRAANFVLGLSTLQMNKDHDFNGTVDNQLRVLEHLGLFRVDWAAEAQSAIRTDGRALGLEGEDLDRYVNRQTTASGQRPSPRSTLLARPPEEHPRLVDPSDASQPVALRARSYLHANCSQCHVEAGGGNAQIDLEFTTADEKTRIFGVRPLHDTFGLADARLVSPGRPHQSVLLHRLSIRGRGQMPQLATTEVDQEAVRLLAEWIQSLEAESSERRP